MSQWKPSPRMLAWIAFLAVCVGAGGLYVWNIHRYRTALAVWQSKERRSELQRQAAYQRIERFWNDYGRDGMSRAKVEQALNLGNPLKRWNHGSQEEFLYQDPVTKGLVELRFTDDAWSGIGMYHSYLPDTSNPSPTRSRYGELYDRAWRSITGPYSLLAWVVLFGLLLVLRKHRPLIAQLMFAVGIFCTVSWLANKTYPLNWHRILSNDTLFLALGMLAVSAMTWRAVTRPSAPTYPQCDQCGYNLTGNVSGICPECGTPVDDGQTQQAKSDNVASTMDESSPPTES